MQKTIPTTASVSDFILQVPDEVKRNDCHVLVQIMQQISGYPAVMWGPSIIGFGQYQYRYASGHTGIAPLLGFSPRKNDLTLYVFSGAPQTKLLERLGKHKTSKACLYIKRLADINIDVLRELIADSLDHFQKNQRC